MREFTRAKVRFLRKGPRFRVAADSQLRTFVTNARGSAYPCTCHSLGEYANVFTIDDVMHRFYLANACLYENCQVYRLGISKLTTRLSTRSDVFHLAEGRNRCSFFCYEILSRPKTLVLATERREQSRMRKINVSSNSCEENLGSTSKP